MKTDQINAVGTVAVLVVDQMVFVRDRFGSECLYTRDEWQEFLDAVVDGKFDL